MVDVEDTVQQLKSIIYLNKVAISRVTPEGIFYCLTNSLAGKYKSRANTEGFSNYTAEEEAAIGYNLKYFVQLFEIRSYDNETIDGFQLGLCRQLESIYEDRERHLQARTNVVLQGPERYLILMANVYKTYQDIISDGPPHETRSLIVPSQRYNNQYHPKGDEKLIEDVMISIQEVFSKEDLLQLRNRSKKSAECLIRSIRCVQS